MTDAALRARYLDALGIDRYLLRHPPAAESVATASPWSELEARVARKVCGFVNVRAAMGDSGMRSVAVRDRRAA